MLKYIITGTGRSGTNYTCNVFRDAGFYAIHEGILAGDVIRMEKTVDGQHQVANVEVESNLMAPVWFGKDIPMITSAMILHIVRDPIPCINSMVRRGIHNPESPNDYFRDMCKIVPEMQSLNSELDRVVMFYCRWNKHIMTVAPSNPGGYLIHRVEDGARLLFEKLKLPRGLCNIEVERNDKKWRPEDTTKIQLSNYSDIKNDSLREELIELSTAYGYYKDETPKVHVSAIP
jgi:hypothetical protein